MGKISKNNSYWFLIEFLLGIVILLLFFSCGLTKKSLTTTTKQTEKTEVATDTTSKETINKVIKDEAIFKIAESNTGDRDFDLAVNNAVTNILRSINFQKSSGDNSYKIYYDEQLKSLRAEIELGETRNKEISTNKEATSEKTLEESVSEYIKKIVIPWWVYLIPIFLFRKQIFGVLSFVFPQLLLLRKLKSVKDIITPPGNPSP